MVLVRTRCVCVGSVYTKPSTSLLGTESHQKHRGLPFTAEMLRLQAALQAAFPGCTDLSDDPSRGIAAFRPHLSLGQWRSAADAQDAQQARAGLVLALPAAHLKHVKHVRCQTLVPG